MDWIYLVEDSDRWGRGCFERDNEPSIKCVQFLGKQLTCELLMKNPDSWS
jgi:hypothetical protein